MFLYTCTQTSMCVCVRVFSTDFISVTHKATSVRVFFAVPGGFAHSDLALCLIERLNRVGSQVLAPVVGKNVEAKDKKMASLALPRKL